MRTARGKQIPTLLCSSFPGVAVVEGTDGLGRRGSANYAGCHNDSEVPIDADNNGLLFLNSKIRYSEILDGSSQTILIGEFIPSPRTLGWASGTRATLRNTSGFEPRDQWREESDADLGSFDVGGFGSFHSGGAQFTFADGSTQFLSHTINPNLFRQFGNRADGELLEDQ